MPDEGGAVPHEAGVLPLGRRLGVGERDEAAGQHAGEQARIALVPLARRLGDGLELLGVGEVEADPDRHEQVVEPRPERAGLDHDREGMRGRVIRRQGLDEARGLRTPRARPVNESALFVDDRDGDVALVGVKPGEVRLVGNDGLVHHGHDWPPAFGVRAPARCPLRVAPPM